MEVVDFRVVTSCSVVVGNRHFEGSEDGSRTASETSVSNHHTIWRNDPENNGSYLHHREKLKSHGLSRWKAKNIPSSSSSSSSVPHGKASSEIKHAVFQKASKSDYF